MIWIGITLYTILLLLIAFQFRHHTGSDEFLMAHREAGWIKVSAGLFTLIGGGEFVTLASLGFVYGWGAIALFLGYALGFIFLGLIAGRLRENSSIKRYVSLPDYVHDKFGAASGLIVFMFSFLAFFALLMLQFATAGAVISPFTDLSYEQIVIYIAVVVTAYLLIGGFKAVLVTDVVQAVVMAILLPALLLYIFLEKSVGFENLSGIETLPLALWASLVFTGFFVVCASADVWQRAYAAKSDKVAKIGFVVGAFGFLLFGFVIVSIGIAAHQFGVTDANSAFVQVMTSTLTPVLTLVVTLMVLSAIMSTADTETFLLTGLVQRELQRYPLFRSLARLTSSVSGVRLLMVILSSASIVFAIKYSSLVDIYTWLLSALVVISPIILFSLFWHASSVGMFLSLLANTIVFVVLTGTGILTLDNIYLISIPGIVFYTISLVFRKQNLPIRN